MKKSLYIILPVILVAAASYFLSFSYSEGTVGISIPLGHDARCQDSYNMYAGMHGVGGKKMRTCVAY